MSDPITGFKELMSAVSGPGDLATVLIAGTVGFTVDAGLNAIGFLSPGAVGMLAASSALGLKKTAEARNRKRREQAATGAAYTEIERRLSALAEILRKRADMIDLAGAADAELALVKERVQSVEGAAKAIDSLLSKYSARVIPGWPP